MSSPTCPPRRKLRINVKLNSKKYKCIRTYRVGGRSRVAYLYIYRAGKRLGNPIASIRISH